MNAELKQLKTTESDLCIAFAETRIGGRYENQDSFGYKETKHGLLITVCDGMGGGPGGKTASTIAVREIIAGIDESSNDEELSNLIIKAVRRANMAIFSTATDNPELQGMGSTATVLLITTERAFVAHVGDSRVYQIRGTKKIFRTFDHSMVFDLVKQGVISEEQARLSAQSNVITRALGIKPDVEVELNVLPYKKGDRFVLCSDGIHGTMPEVDLIRMFANRKNSLGAVTDDISTLVDNQGRESGGGHDNLTLAMIETTRSSTAKNPLTTLQKMIWGIVAAISLACAIVVVYLCLLKEEPQSEENAVQVIAPSDTTKVQPSEIVESKIEVSQPESTNAELKVDNMQSKSDNKDCQPEEKPLPENANTKPEEPSASHKETKNNQTSK